MIWGNNLVPNACTSSEKCASRCEKYSDRPGLFAPIFQVVVKAEIGHCSDYVEAATLKVTSKSCLMHRELGHCFFILGATWLILVVYSLQTFLKPNGLLSQTSCSSWRFNQFTGHKNRSQGQKAKLRFENLGEDKELGYASQNCLAWVSKVMCFCFPINPPFQMTRWFTVSKSKRTCLEGDVTVFFSVGQHWLFSGGKTFFATQVMGQPDLRAVPGILQGRFRSFLLMDKLNTRVTSV